MSRLNHNIVTDVSNVDVWSTQTQFDYSNWNEISDNAELKFMKVNWEKNYIDVVDWKSESNRNNYFFNETHDGELVLPSTEFNLKDSMVWSSDMNSSTGGQYLGLVRVEEPQQALHNYNYVVLDNYDLPVPGSTDRLTKLFYFIIGTSQLSPNSTAVSLMLDVWTTFYGQYDIEALELTRGHYAHKATPVSSYLSDPLSTPIPLNYEEPDLPKLKPKVSYTNLVSATKNNPRICIATTLNWLQLDTMWETGGDIKTSSWWNSMNTSVHSVPRIKYSNRTLSGRKTPTGINVYSVTPGDFSRLINYISSINPVILSEIKAVYVLPESLINESSGSTIFSGTAGETLIKTVSPVNSPTKLLELGITKDLFGYDNKNSDFSKLYSGQFASIVISDFNGKSIEITVDEISKKLEFYSRAVSSFPYLKLEAFINGVGGDTSKTYSVAPLTSSNATGFNSKWTEYLFELNIPTYSVFTASADIELSQHKGVLNHDILNAQDKRRIKKEVIDIDKNKNIDASGRDSTIEKMENKLSYDNSHNNIDNSYSVSIATNLVMKNNSVLSNTNSNAVSKASNLSTRDNSVLSNNTSHTITLNNNTTAKDVSDNTTNTDYDNDVASNTLNRDLSILNTDANFDIAEANSRYARHLMLYNQYIANIGYDIKYSTQSLAVTMAVVNTGLSAVSGGLMMGPAGAALGIVNGVGGIVGALHEQNVTESANTLSFNSILANHNINSEWNNAGFSASQEGKNYVFEENRSLARVAADYSKALGQDIRVSTYNHNTLRNARNLNLGLNNASTIKTNADANSLTTRNTSNTIANNIKTVSDSNADSILTTDNTIANNTKSTADSNDLSIRNNDRVVTDRTKTVRDTIADLRKNRRDSVAEYDKTGSYKDVDLTYDIDMRNILSEKYKTIDGGMAEFGTQGGQENDSFGERGLEIRVERISNASENIVAKTFRRYGYRVPGVWIESPTLKQMKDFSFWEVDDIWLEANSIPNYVNITIRNIFKSGVFVWDNPDNVKKTKLEDNV